ncbi:MAG: chromosome condensation regulator [Edafosvirus sp.]|uniref:Chromosome condensation regulator n=1 Tax=Edafosvirus sp. TaxID=2487765 RepID=A0A3G4ZT53_9VIRU|nr:MAG: chromosome condensation regulator [Edafosvirus sp.]
MDDNELLLKMPKDLLMIITSYDHQLIFSLPKNFLMATDWFKLIKNNFSLIYSKETTTNDDMMKTYIWNCIKDDLNCDIGAGAYHMIIKSNTGTLMSCGENRYHQQGCKKYEKQPFFSPVTLPIKNTPVSQIICGTFHTTIKLPNGILLNVGYDYNGQLGHEYNNFYGDKHDFRTIKGIPKGPKDISQIVCGNGTTFILLTNGTLVACGNNTNGQLGCGTTASYITKFTEIDTVPKNIVEIVCGQYHTIIRLTDGTLMSTGNNISGQLGHNDFKERKRFEEIKNIPKNIVQVICGEHHTIIRLTDGTLMGCGNNSSGQLGIQNLDLLFTKFVEIKNIPKNIVEVKSGNNHSVIRLTDGTLMSCGSNSKGELGHGDDKYRNTFTKIEDVPKNIIQLICKGMYTMIRLTDDTIMCCGDNTSGQFGNGSYDNDSKFKKTFNLNTI